MDTVAIFGLQFFLSVVVWGLLAKWLLAPWLEKESQRDALFWLTLPHAFRHMGMVFLVPGVVARPLPAAFATPAAYGDLATGVLALLALIALRTGWTRALALVWIFNIVGTVDLLNALRHLAVVPDFGAVWFIPTLYVPLLLVTHFMVFTRLLRRRL
jgi:hypothetical protein